MGLGLLCKQNWCKPKSARDIDCLIKSDGFTIFCWNASQRAVYNNSLEDCCICLYLIFVSDDLFRGLECLLIVGQKAPRDF